MIAEQDSSQAYLALRIALQDSDSAEVSRFESGWHRSRFEISVNLQYDIRWEKKADRYVVKKIKTMRNYG